MTQLRGLLKYIDDDAFLNTWAAVKLENKERLATVIEEQLGIRVDPSAMFDVQVKRIHEYKRQLMNIFGY